MKTSRGSYIRSILGAIVVLFVIVIAASTAVAQSAPQTLPYMTTEVVGRYMAPTNEPTVPMGDGGLATAASISAPRGVAVDSFGNIYIADTSNSRIRKVDHATGIITTVAGGGTGAVVDGALALSVTLNQPRGVDIDAYGNIWIADSSGNRIEKVTPDGVLHLVAKSGKGGYGGDGTNGIVGGSLGVVYNPETVRFDMQGNAIIADVGNCIVRKVTNPGTAGQIITTVAGQTPPVATGTKCTAYGTWTISTTEGLPCTGASAPYMGQVYDVAVDSVGNIFIADSTAYKVRVCYANIPANGTKAGKIYTVAGSGRGCNTNGCPTTGNSSWNTFGPADPLTMDIGHPVGLRVDSRGNLYIADSTNNAIWYLDFSTNRMRQIAGMGTLTPARTVCANSTTENNPTYPDQIGNNCPATWARFGGVQRIALDPAGNLYIAENSNMLIRKILSGTQFGSATAQAAWDTSQPAPVTNNIQVYFPAADGPAASNPFVTAGDFAINPQVDGSSNPITCGLNPDGTATDSSICVVQVAYRPQRAGLVSNALIATSAGSVTGKIALTGMAQGGVVAVDPGTVHVSAFSTPSGVAIDMNGNVFVTDAANGRVARNGATLATGLSNPKAIAVDGAGLLYTADTGNGRIIKLDPANPAAATILIGGLTSPSGVAVDYWGNVYVSDTGNNRVYRLDALTNQLVLFAGGATSACTGASDTVGNGCTPTSAILGAPAGLAVDAIGNLYIADPGSNSIRKVSLSSGLITNASAAVALGAPAGVALDAAGDIYVSDSTGNTVTMISSVPAVLIGTGTAGATGTDGGSATTFALNGPSGIGVDSFGNAVIADNGNNRVLALQRNVASLAFGRKNVGSTSAPQNVVFNNVGNVATTPCFAGSGDSGEFQFGMGCSQSVVPGGQLPVSVTFTPTAVGDFTAQETVQGDALNADVINLTGSGAVLVSTDMTVAPPVTSPVYGQSASVTVTVVVHDPTQAPGITPAGSVACWVGSQQPMSSVTLNSSGVALVDVTPQLVTGSNTVSCSYSPVSQGLYDFDSTSGSGTLTVVKANTTTTLSVASSAQQYTSVCMTATVAPVAPGAGMPTGSVNFFNGTQQLNVDPVTGTLLDSHGNPSPAVVKTLTNGVATFCTGTKPSDRTTLAPGTLNITAVYVQPGDNNFNSSTSAVRQLVVTTSQKDFSFSFTDPTMTVNGQNWTKITVTPINFPNATVTFSCTNLPYNMWCTFTPNTMEFIDVPLDSTRQTSNDAAYPLSIQFTVTTNLNGTASLAAPHRSSQALYALAILCPGLVFGGFGLLSGSRRRKSLRSKLMFLLAFALIGAMIAGGLIGCAGPSKVTQGQTPKGPITIQVTATMTDGAGVNVTHTAPYTVTVQ